MTRFLALGDSYTVGEGVSPNESWPAQLAHFLHLDLFLLAATGWTSGELLQALNAQPPNGPFELVSLSIGVNDQYRGLPQREFVDNTAMLLDRASTLGEAVFVVSIPDWGVTPFAADHDHRQITVDIDGFNAELEGLAVGRGAPFIGVTSISRRRADDVANDGLHPSARQYRAWVDVIAPVAQDLLAGSVPS